MLDAAQPYLLAEAAPPPVPTGGITPRPYQVEGIAAARRMIAEGLRRVLLVLATGGGKCLGFGTPVLRFDGTIVPVEDIRPGDLLMGPDSRPRRVLGTTRGRSPLYRIVPRRGAPWVCNDVHVLTLVHTVTGDVIDVDLPTYLGETKTFRHLYKQFAPAEGVEFEPAAPLPLDPYFVGVWFGDGTRKLAGVAVSKPDEAIAAVAHEIAAKYGLHVRTYHHKSCPTHHIAAARGQHNELLHLMREINGDGTVLPYAYLTASRSDREAFLAGLLDTDGYLHRTGYEIVQLRRGYADGIAFLAHSLGLRALMVPKVVEGTTYWRVHISGDCSGLPLRITRKMAPPRRQKKCATRTGFSVEAIGEGEYAGFELDGDGRFLLGDFTVTHNTAVAALIGHGAVSKGKRVLFVGPRREIIAQAFWKLVEAGIPELSCGVVMAAGVIPHVITREPYSARRPMAPVQVASIQTLANRRLPPADVVFVDEAHHSTSATWSKVIDHYIAAGAVVVGLTATPCRADGKGLGKLFERLHVIAGFAELAEAGYLTTPRVYTTPNAPDLSKVKLTRSGEYAADDLATTMRARGLVGDVVAHWQRRAEGRTTAVFAASVEHSRELCDAFRAAGVAADHVDANTPADERDAALTRLARGETTVLCNMGICTEGWDLPRCKCIVLARPTKSLSLYLQMAGRGLRPWQGVEAIILDHAGCAHEHGLPQDAREWSLDGRVRRTGSVSVRTCPQCYAALPGGTPVCDACGYVFPIEAREPGGLQHEEGELVEAVSRTTATMDERVSTYEGMLRDSAGRGRKVGYARHRYRELYGIWPAGGRLKALERVHYPPAVEEPSLPAEDDALSPEPGDAALLPEAPCDARPLVESDATPQVLVERPEVTPRRARRIDLGALLADLPAAPAAPEEVEQWSL